MGTSSLQCDPSNAALFYAAQCDRDEGAGLSRCYCVDPVTGAALDGTASSGWSSNNLIACEPGTCALPSTPGICGWAWGKRGFV